MKYEAIAQELAYLAGSEQFILDIYIELKFILRLQEPKM